MNSTQAQTASTWTSGSLWLIVVFIGAFVLIAAIAWSRRKNDKITPEEHARTEQATHDLYQSQNDDDQLRDR